LEKCGIIKYVLLFGNGKISLVCADSAETRILRKDGRIFMSNMFYFLAATAAPVGMTEEQATAQMISSVLMMVVVLVIFYFMLIRPQNKKEKEQKKMRENIQIGDEVTTIGGIVGIIVRKGDDTVVIETGGDRSKIRVKTWAISENLTKHDEEAELGKKK